MHNNTSNFDPFHLLSAYKFGICIFVCQSYRILKTSLYLAKTFYGLESVLATELEDLGAQNVKVLNRAVSFHADLEVLYAANYLCRTAIKILFPLKTYEANNEAELYKGAYDMPWEDWFQVNRSIAMDTLVKSDLFQHTHYVGLKVKDAVVDRFRDKTKRRPDVDTENPDVKIHVYVEGNKCTLMLDASGNVLFKRGYRTESNGAPLNEVLAAGMVLLSSWDKQRAFYDGMSGSGTLLIEAALIATNTPPQHKRDMFSFMNWRNYNPAIWFDVKEKAKEKILDYCPVIMGRDVSAQFLKLSRENATRAGVSKFINLKQQNFLQGPPDEKEPFVIMNPPYGERMGSEIEEMYSKIGDTLKKYYKGSDVWIISSNMDALKSVGLKTSQRIPLYNGGLECRFNHFELYEGSKKIKSDEI